MTITLFTIGKRLNSTIRPRIQSGASYSCNLKGPTEILYPRIELTSGNISDDPTVFNYAYLSGLNRFYFIETWQWDNRKWIAHLAIDVLGSHSTAIANLEPYVLRASYGTIAETDPAIIDNMYPTKAGVSFESIEIVSPLCEKILDAQGRFKSNAGIYIVGIINKNSAAGGVSYYAFAPSSFYLFTSQLFNSTTYNFASITQAASELSENFLKTLINPFQYVVSCMWFPIDTDALYTRSLAFETLDVTVGWWNMSLSAPAWKLYEINVDLAYYTVNALRIPKRSELSTRGKYLALAPYSTYTLSYAPFGEFDVDPINIVDSDYLHIITTIDLRSGKGVLQFSNIFNYDLRGHPYTQRPFRTVEAQVGVSIPLASIVSNPVDAKTAGMAAGASVIANSGGNVGGFFKRIGATVTRPVLMAITGDKELSKELTPEAFGSDDVSGILSSAMSVKTTAEVTGMTGTWINIISRPLTLTARYTSVVDEDFADKGRPLCKISRLGDLTGFTLCDSFEPAISGIMSAETEMIRNFLTSGFFAEWGYL